MLAVLAVLAVSAVLAGGVKCALRPFFLLSLFRSFRIFASIVPFVLLFFPPRPPPVDGGCSGRQKLSTDSRLCPPLPPRPPPPAPSTKPPTPPSNGSHRAMYSDGRTTRGDTNTASTTSSVGWRWVALLSSLCPPPFPCLPPLFDDFDDLDRREDDDDDDDDDDGGACAPARSSPACFPTARSRAFPVNTAPPPSINR